MKTNRPPECGFDRTPQPRRSKGDGKPSPADLDEKRDYGNLHRLGESGYLLEFAESHAHALANQQFFLRGIRFRFDDDFDRPHVVHFTRFENERTWPTDLLAI